MSAQRVSHRDIGKVLAGRGSYDELSAREQSLVRAEWDERIKQAHQGLDLEAEFVASRDTWVEADPDGNPVTHSPPIT